MDAAWCFLEKIMRYTLQLTRVNQETMQVESQSIEGNSLIEIAAKIPIMIANEMRKIQEEINEIKSRPIDDDIPF
jgi:hypothetical protein